MNSIQNENVTQPQTKEKQKWTTLHVPVEVLETLKKIKSYSKEDKANWKIITEALSYYSSVLSSKNMRVSDDEADRVAWYILKLNLSYSKFLENPTEETYSNLQLRLNEIAQRLNVSTEALQKLAEQYLRIKKDEEKMKTRITLNQAVKLLIKQMMLMACTSSEEQS